MTKHEQSLLDSIKPGMKMDKGFLLRVYGHTMTNPGYSDLVIQKLKAAGCSKAKEYYDQTIAEYERQWREEIRPVARKWRKVWQEEHEKKVKEYERKEGEELRRRRTQDLLRKSDRELLRLLQIMNSSS